MIIARAVFEGGGGGVSTWARSRSPSLAARQLLPTSPLQERQFREKVQRSTAMKLEAEMRAEGAALLDGLKGQLAHMAAVDYGVPTSPY